MKVKSGQKLFSKPVVLTLGRSSGSPGELLKILTPSISPEFRPPEGCPRHPCIFKAPQAVLTCNQGRELLSQAVTALPVPGAMDLPSLSLKEEGLLGRQSWALPLDVRGCQHLGLIPASQGTLEAKEALGWVRVLLCWVDKPKTEALQMGPHESRG